MTSQDTGVVLKPCRVCEARERDWWKPDPDDTFWMLEVRQGFDNAGSWLKNEDSHLTTRDPARALRYPNRFHADCVRRRLYPDDGKFEPTEHSWIEWTDTRTPENQHNAMSGPSHE